MGVVSIVMVSVLCGHVAWWLVVSRLLRRSRFRARARAAHGAFMAFQLVALLLVFVSRRAEWGVALPTWLFTLVYLWHLLVLPLLMPFAVLALVGAAARRIAARREQRAYRTPVLTRATPPPGVSRREFIAATAAVVPPLLNLSLAGIALAQLDHFRLRRFVIPVHGLAPVLDGVSIAHVSDMHVGRFTRSGVLEKLVGTVNELRADLVLLTGDLINGALHELPEAIATVRQFAAGSGVYMVEGNHDLFQGRAEFEGEVRASGIPLLVNEAANLAIAGEPVQLLGLRWGGPGSTNRRARTGDKEIGASMDELLKLRNPRAFPIVLAHHPHAFDFAAAAGIPLTLAGHTHGGQLMLTDEAGFGPMLYRYWSGMYKRGLNHLVVSNGVGNWYPLRTRAPAEILHLILRRV